MFCLEKYQILPGRVKHIMYQTMRDMKCRELPVWYWAGRQYCTVWGRDLFLIEVVVAIVILNQVFCTLHCYYICWSYINWEAPQENQVTSSPASQTRPVSQSATLSGFFHSFLWTSPYLPRSDPCYVVVIETTPTSDSSYFFSGGRIVLVWWDQFWLPGRPARHHQTKPCWQPSYWSLRSPVSSSPVTPDCKDHFFQITFQFSTFHPDHTVITPGTVLAWFAFLFPCWGKISNIQIQGNWPDGHNRCNYTEGLLNRRKLVVNLFHFQIVVCSTML